MSVQKKLLCLFHWKPSPSALSLESPGPENIPQVPGNGAEVAQNHDARKTVSATILVFKWSGAIFLPRVSKLSVHNVFLCPFHCKPRQSGVSLESLGLEYIPEVMENRTEVSRNHDARKAVSATLSVLMWTAAIFRPKTSKMSVRTLLLCPFYCKPRPSGVSSESAGLENIPQVPGNGAEIGQNYDARKAVPATLSVLKWSGAIFRPRSSKVSVQKLLLCQFHCKPRQSGVSLESPELENIPQVPGNLAEVGQNHVARKLVSATFSVLKWSRTIFLPRSLKVSVQKVSLCLFLCKPRRSGVRLESPGLENIPKIPGNLAEVGQNHHMHKAVSANLSVLKWSGAIFLPRSSKVTVQKVFMSISLQTKASRS